MSVRAIALPLFLLVTLLAARWTPPLERGGIVAGPARQRLMRDWDAQTGGVNQVERAYCVTRYAVATVPWESKAGETRIYVATEVEPAVVDGATPWAIQEVTCPTSADGSPMPMVHTHPASECNRESGVCVADSSRMTQNRCEPSSIDVASVAKLKLPFAVIQCARGVFTFYAPPLP